MATIAGWKADLQRKTVRLSVSGECVHNLVACNASAVRLTVEELKA